MYKGFATCWVLLKEVPSTYLTPMKVESDVTV